MRFRGRTDILSGCALPFLKKGNRKFYRLPDPVLVAADLNQSTFGRVISRTNQIDLLSPFPPIWGIPSGPAKFNLGSFLSGVPNFLGKWLLLNFEHISTLMSNRGQFDRGRANDKIFLLQGSTTQACLGVS